MSLDILGATGSSLHCAQNLPQHQFARDTISLAQAFLGTCLCITALGGTTLACQKYDLVFIIALQSVFAQGLEIAFQDLPTTAVPTRSGQGTGTMPKGSKNSSTALRTPG